MSPKCDESQVRNFNIVVNRDEFMIILRIIHNHLCRDWYSSLQLCVLQSSRPCVNIQSLLICWFELWIGLVHSFKTLEELQYHFSASPYHTLFSIFLRACCILGIFSLHIILPSSLFLCAHPELNQSLPHSSPSPLCLSSSSAPWGYVQLYIINLTALPSATTLICHEVHWSHGCAPSAYRARCHSQRGQAGSERGTSCPSHILRSDLLSEHAYSPT